MDAGSAVSAWTQARRSWSKWRDPSWFQARVKMELSLISSVLSWIVGPRSGGTFVKCRLNCVFCVQFLFVSVHVFLEQKISFHSMSVFHVLFDVFSSVFLTKGRGEKAPQTRRRYRNFDAPFFSSSYKSARSKSPVHQPPCVRMEYSMKCQPTPFCQTGEDDFLSLRERSSSPTRMIGPSHGACNRLSHGVRTL